MRNLTLILAAASCIGLATPAFSTERPLTGPSGLASVTDLSRNGAADAFSAQNKKQAKKKKTVKEKDKGTTGRSSWGG